MDQSPNRIQSQLLEGTPMNGGHPDVGLESSLRIDRKHRLYIRQRGHNVEAFTFEDVFLTTNALAGLLGMPTRAAQRSKVGTLEAFSCFLDLRALAGAANDGDAWFHATTLPPVRRALRQARICHRKVRLFYGDPATGRDALHVRDVVGWIGAGGVPHKRPMLLAAPNHRAGVPIPDSSIVRIQDIEGFCDLYRHPQYSLPQLTILPMIDGTTRVLVEGGVHVDFKGDAQANRWVQFLNGTSPTAGARRTAPARAEEVQ